MGLLNYARLIRFRSHLTFGIVLIGALFFADKINISIIPTLFLLYIAFNVLMYGGLYTMNEIGDLESDKRHPVKNNRPLPSGRISVGHATAFSVLSIFLGLAFAYLYFGKLIFYFFLLFILLNVIYTFFAKKVPYVELIFNGFTHPLRFAMGGAFVGATLP